MKQPDLKPCPFCGGDAEITYGAYDENCWGVRCETCGAMVSTADFSMHDAVEAWNARTENGFDDFDFRIARRGFRPEAQIISTQVPRLSCMQRVMRREKHVFLYCGAPSSRAFRGARSNIDRRKTR